MLIMKLYKRYFLLLVLIIFISLYLIFYHFKEESSSGISNYDFTLEKQRSVSTSIDPRNITRLLDQFTNQNVSCFKSKVKINPFVDGPHGLPTLSPDKQLGNCVKVHFSPVDLPRTALASYQGSGNTWLRHLIHELTGEAYAWF